MTVRSATARPTRTTSRTIHAPRYPASSASFKWRFTPLAPRLAAPFHYHLLPSGLDNVMTSANRRLTLQGQSADYSWWAWNIFTGVSLLSRLISLSKSHGANSGRCVL